MASQPWPAPVPDFIGGGFGILAWPDARLPPANDDITVLGFNLDLLAIREAGRACDLDRETDREVLAPLPDHRMWRGPFSLLG